MGVPRIEVFGQRPTSSDQEVLCDRQVPHPECADKAHGAIRLNETAALPNASSLSCDI